MKRSHISFKLFIALDRLCFGVARGWRANILAQLKVASLVSTLTKNSTLQQDGLFVIISSRKHQHQSAVAAQFETPVIKSSYNPDFSFKMAVKKNNNSLMLQQKLKDFLYQFYIDLMFKPQRRQLDGNETHESRMETLISKSMVNKCAVKMKE